MVFNNSENGIQNEISFVKKINNMQFKDLNYNLQLFLIDIFRKEIKDEEVIKCWKNDIPQKYDIFIKIKFTTKRISIKKGIKNSVHTEPISEFIHFLISNGLKKELIIKFLKYHYADGSTNGSGSKRISISEYKKDNQEDIDEINKVLNDEYFLRKAIKRFIVRGRNSFYDIDALLYGVPEDFIWIKKNDIYKIILKNKDIYSTAIHFGPLTYQPLDRCLNYNSKYEYKRFISQVKWFSLADNIIENMNDNVINNVED